MNVAIDLVGVALIALNVFLGWRYGLLRRGISLAGVFGAVGLASLVGNGVARFFHGGDTPSGLYADAWAFVAIAAVGMLGMEILGALYHDKITRIASLMFDRTVGAALGLLVGALQIAVFCVVGLAVGSASSTSASPLPLDRHSVSDDVRSSVIGGRVNSVETGILNVFRPVLPDDLPKHLTESAGR